MSISASRHLAYPLGILGTVGIVVLVVILGNGPNGANGESAREGEKEAADAGPPLPVGVAMIDITPEGPIRLSGYGSRDRETAEIEQKLFAKALAIGGDEDGPAVLVSVDCIGLPAALVEDVAAKLKERAGLERAQLAFCATHSHTAPSIKGLLEFIFGEPLTAEQRKHVEAYAGRLGDALVKVVIEALESRRPGRLSWAEGTVDFAANRRVLREGTWRGFGVNPDGPVDHGLPLLRVTDEDEKLRAVVVNYACHCTTLGPDFNKLHGDWAGEAQALVEERHPGATAMVVIGCGADANPEPRGKLDYAKRHGKAVADEVDRLLAGDFTPLAGPPQVRFERITLNFAELPERAEWEARAKARNRYAYYARHVLEMLDAGKTPQQELDYPVQTWAFGDDLAMVFLAGEVVADYALRLKTEFDGPRLWVTAYANDVPCYIASRRMLAEGGYEVDGSMNYYGRPGRLAEGTEERIVAAVEKLLPKAFHEADEAASFPRARSPRESMAAIEVPDGMRVELVAAEPLVRDPIDVAWGPDGRLWVVEMGDYPLGEQGKSWPGGRVRFLEDRDGDGQYDTSTVFMDEVNFPTSVAPWRDGVLVTAAPELLYARDTDADGVADDVETLYSGFREGNQQHRVNGLRWGLDNWLYLANGDSGGRILSERTRQVVDLGARDLRIRPDEGLMDLQTGRTQYGRNRDDWGNWFGSNNSKPKWHFVLADHYLRRNPNLKPPEPIREVPEQPGAAPVYPLSRTLPRFNQPEKAERITSACSTIVYRDNLLGEEYGGNSFVCEPVHNLVHREIMSADGVTFTSRRAEGERESEFLASRDNWFRPTSVRTGPDGALWVVDMYRLVIEHPEWIPQQWQEKLDLRAGQDKGRIYRVYPAGAKLRTVPRLDEVATADVVAALDSPNGPQRDLAQQVLLWRADPVAVQPLERMAAEAQRPLARLHALCTLDGLGKLKPKVIRRALEDEHPGVRRHVVRLSEPHLASSSALGEALVSLMDDEDPQVRMQLAYSLGEWPDPRAGRALGRLLVAHEDDPYMRAAALSSLNPTNVKEVLVAVFGEAAKGASEDLLGEVLKLAGAVGDRETLVEVLKLVSEPRDGAYAVWQMNALAGMLEVSHAQSELRELLGERSRKELAGIFAFARKAAGDDAAEPGARTAAIRLVGNRGRPGQQGGGPEADVELLGSLLAARQPPAVQQAAVEALVSLRDPRGADVLLADIRGYSPRMRSLVLDALLRRPAWTGRLLAAIEEGRVSGAQLGAARRQRLLEHEDPAVRKRAEALLKAAADSDRKQVVEAHLKMLDMKGDAARGREVFRKRCAACHKLEKIGHDVGPELAALKDKSPQALLVAVLDPNRAVEDKFIAYTAVMLDGRVLNGMLAGETATTITLTNSEGKQEVILRQGLERLHATGKSLMPEGLEKDVSPEELADLLAYLAEALP